ncbi:MAG: hypothetical protein ABR499_14390 [Gemmatimonadaceae bacterium]
MIIRRTSLSQALDELESGTLTGVSTLVVSRRWWDALSAHERTTYRTRARHAGIELRADSAMSAHFVEVRGGESGPPLSTERPM